MHSKQRRESHTTTNNTMLVVKKSCRDHLEFSSGSGEWSFFTQGSMIGRRDIETLQ
jgi:hypothetical protein